MLLYLSIELGGHLSNFISFSVIILGSQHYEILRCHVTMYAVVSPSRSYRAETIWYLGCLMRFSCGAALFLCQRVLDLTTGCCACRHLSFSLPRSPRVASLVYVERFCGTMSFSRLVVKTGCISLQEDQTLIILNKMNNVFWYVKYML